MAGSVTKRARTLLVLILAAVSAGATAQEMSDPTRPPALLAPDTGGNISAAPLLQSVIITPTRRSAIIDGQHVQLGGKYGDARVVKITDSEVVLRSAGSDETLRMYPDVEIRPVKPPTVPPPEARKAHGRKK